MRTEKVLIVCITMWKLILTGLVVGLILTVVSGCAAWMIEAAEDEGEFIVKETEKIEQEELERKK